MSNTQITRCEQCGGPVHETRLSIGDKVRIKQLRLGAHLHPEPTETEGVIIDFDRSSFTVRADGQNRAYPFRALGDTVHLTGETDPQVRRALPVQGVIGQLVERILAAGFNVGVLNRPGDYLSLRICADMGETMLCEEWALTYQELKCGPKEGFVDLCDQRIQRLREAIAERKAGDDDL